MMLCVRNTFLNFDAEQPTRLSQSEPRSFRPTSDAPNRSAHPLKSASPVSFKNFALLRIALLRFA